MWKHLIFVVVFGATGLSFGASASATSPKTEPEALVVEPSEEPSEEPSARAFAPEEEISMGRRRRRRSSSTKKKSTTRRRRRRLKNGQVQTVGGSRDVIVPIDVGIAPTFNFISGVVQGDQLFHTGLRISVEAVLSQKLIRQNINKVPKKYRKMVARSTEIRMDVTPWYVPQSLVISPKIGDGNTGIYGVAFNPLGVGLTLTPSPLRFSLGAGAMLKYMFIHSDTLPSPTHFIRPGIELNADFEFPIVPDVFYLSLGWGSQFYIPQKVGALPWEVPTGIKDSIWHVGQAYLMAHFRFPYTKSL